MLARIFTTAFALAAVAFAAVPVKRQTDTATILANLNTTLAPVLSQFGE